MRNIDSYIVLHRNPKMFAGFSIKTFVKDIAHLVERNRPERLLDYGSGKGYQYLVRRYHEQWGGLLPHCYDPGAHHLSKRPEGKFDGIICTDVLEHIDERDLDEVLADIFSFLPQKRKVSFSDRDMRFVFLAICCDPSKKTFEDGRDIHITIKPPEWWRSKIDVACRKAAIPLLCVTVKFVRKGRV